MDYIEISAKNKDEAIIKASMQLETPSDELDIQIISEGSSGFLGFGSKPAIIRVRKKESTELQAEEEVRKISEEAIKAVSLKPEIMEKAESAEKPEKKEKPEVKAEAPAKTHTRKPSRAESKKHERRNEERPAKKAVKEQPKEAAKQPEKPAKKESRPIELITDEAEIADITKRAVDFLEGVFGAMNLEVQIKAGYNTEERCLDVEFVGEDMGILIGKRGQTLDSLQYLTSLVVNKGKNSYVRVKLDTEDYRSRRKETLENLAKGIAYKVRKTRKPVVLEPMNPYERRIIHSTLQGNRYVETFSEGEEPYRHVVVKMKGRRS